MVSDTELDEFIDGELKKDITQENSMDANVESSIGEMGYLWNQVQVKFREDNTCFKCKEKIKQNKKDNTKIVNVVEAKKVEKGVIAFVCLCEKCFKNMKGEK